MKINNKNLKIIVSILFTVIIFIGCDIQPEVKDCEASILKKNVLCINNKTLKNNKQIQFTYSNLKTKSFEIFPTIEILGNLNGIHSDDLQGKVLANNNVLLFSNPQSYVFNQKNNSIKYIPKPFEFLLGYNDKSSFQSLYTKAEEILGEWNFVRQPQGIFQLNKDEYLLYPIWVYNQRTNEYSLLPKEKLQALNDFVKQRVYHPYNDSDNNTDKTKVAVQLNVFSNNTMLLGGGPCFGPQDNVDVIEEIWLENPLTLKRFKYGKMLNPRTGFSSVMQSNGKLLLIGGFACRKDSNGWAYLDTIEEYDPQTGKVKLIGHLQLPRGNAKVALLKNDKVFIAGGLDSKDGVSKGVQLKPEIFDPETGTSTLLNNVPIVTLDNVSKEEQQTYFKIGQDNFEIKLLKNGKVFIYGMIALLYAPESNTFQAINNIKSLRFNPTIVELDNGNLLIAGGSAYEESIDSLSKEEKEKLVFHISLERWHLED